MCGRFSVKDKSVSTGVNQDFGISYSVKTNIDLRPTQTVSVIIWQDKQFNQLNAHWGIKPNWADKLLINAQAETVGQKPTFKKAFQTHRCVVPCSGWYEWQKQGDKKIRYYFSHAEGKTLYMAGIYYLKENEPAELVTLTTTPNKKFSEIHSRMPALILMECIEDWFLGSPEQAQKLLLPVPDNYITFQKIESLEEVI